MAEKTIHVVKPAKSGTGQVLTPEQAAKFMGVDLAAKASETVYAVSMSREKYNRLIAAERERDEWKDLHDEVVKTREELLGALNEKNSELEQERDSLKQQITELDKSTDDLQFKVKAVERLVGVLEKKLAERDAACAEMREALELWQQSRDMPISQEAVAIHHKARALCRTALSSSVLERVRLLETDKETAKELLEYLRDRANVVISNDKTRYDHHEPRPDGKQPRENGGTCWLTPKELAKQMLSAIDAHLKRGGKDG